VNNLSEGISANSTAVLIRGLEKDSVIVSGSKTEGALLVMLLFNFGVDYTTIRAETFDADRGDRLFTFSSARKRMTVLLMNGDRRGGGRLYTKGASEVVLSRCSKYTDSVGDERPITDAIRNELLTAIDGMAKRALRTIAVAHRDLSGLSGMETADDIEKDMVIDAIFGIKDPLRPDVTEAVLQCQAAGIFVRMVTGDNIETAKAIAKECGILTEGGIAMEGPAFRKLTPAQLDAILPTLQVLARSSPDDKHTLVTRLNGHALPDSREKWEALHPDYSWEKDRDSVLPGYMEEWLKSRAAQGDSGEVVGVTGDGTNDGPALKAADVGLSMGLSGTDGTYCIFLYCKSHIACI
jgi:magnesium-transporting ATPase (P-type)